MNSTADFTMWRNPDYGWVNNPMQNSSQKT